MNYGPDDDMVHDFKVSNVAQWDDENRFQWYQEYASEQELSQDTYITTVLYLECCEVE